MEPRTTYLLRVLGLPTSTLGQENAPTDLPIGDWWRHVFQLRFPFPRWPWPMPSWQNLASTRRLTHHLGWASGAWVFVAKCLHDCLISWHSVHTPAHAGDAWAKSCYIGSLHRHPGFALVCCCFYLSLLFCDYGRTQLWRSGHLSGVDSLLPPWVSGTELKSLGSRDKYLYPVSHLPSSTLPGEGPCFVVQSGLKLEILLLQRHSARTRSTPSTASGSPRMLASSTVRILVFILG